MMSTLSVSLTTNLFYSQQRKFRFSRRFSVSARGKGFGDRPGTQSNEKTGGSKRKGGKRKGAKGISEKEQERRERQRQQQKEASAGAVGVQKGYTGYGGMTNLPEVFEDKREVADQEQVEFEERLSALKETGTLLAKEKRINQQAENSTSADIYANPPKIVEVLAPQTPEQVADDAQKVKVGPSQFAIVGGSILLIAVFAITNGAGDLFIGAGGGSKQQEQVIQLNKEEMQKVQENIDELKTKLKGDESDITTLRSIATADIAVGNYQEAEQFLTKLTDLEQTDVDGWSMLAQTRGALGDNKGKINAYQNAVKFDSSKDIQILQGLTGALVADGKPQEAIQLVNNYLQQPSSIENATPDLSEGEGGQAEGVGQDNQPVNYNPIELQLLLGKVYSQWSGHNGDALSVFDRIIKNYQEDFRGYLAKGVLLRNMDRKSDAERMFLQAKFYAPKGSKGLVDQIANQS